MSGFVIWITGLSGSGKSTLSKEVYEKIKQQYVNTIRLDGDEFREIMGNDMNHTHNNRVENAKRIHRMCAFLISQNINVICSTMSLYDEIYQLNKMAFKKYFMVFVKCDIEELIRRDQKGIYSDSIAKKRNDVIGLDVDFDIPPYDLEIDNTASNLVEIKAKNIIQAALIKFNKKGTI